MVMGLRERRDGRSWKVGEMSHSDNSDSLAELAKVTTQWWWKHSLTNFILVLHTIFLGSLKHCFPQKDFI